MHCSIPCFNQVTSILFYSILFYSIPYLKQAPSNLFNILFYSSPSFNQVRSIPFFYFLFCLSILYYILPCHSAAHAGIAVHPPRPSELREKVRWSSLTSRRHQHTDLLIYKVTLSELPRYLTYLVGFNVNNHKKTLSQDQFSLRFSHTNSNKGGLVSTSMHLTTGMKCKENWS